MERVKFVSGAFLDDLAIPRTGRGGFAAELFDEFQSGQSQLLQVKDFEGLLLSRFAFTMSPVAFLPLDDEKECRASRRLSKSGCVRPG
jgi:hypothetical protein